MARNRAWPYYRISLPGYRRGGGHSTGAEAELAFAADLPDFGGCDTIHSDTEVRPLDGVELLRRLRGLIGRECTYLGRSCRLLEILAEEGMLVMETRETTADPAGPIRTPGLQGE